MNERLKAVRGAITVEADERELIIEAVQELTRTVMEKNGVAPEDIVSIIYTTTEDLRSEFPAVGARAIGLVHTPLMCAQEISVPGSQPRCIRMLLHAYMPVDRPVVPVYLREAVSLRPDLHSESVGGVTSNDH